MGFHRIGYIRHDRTTILVGTKAVAHGQTLRECEYVHARSAGHGEANGGGGADDLHTRCSAFRPAYKYELN